MTNISPTLIGPSKHCEWLMLWIVGSNQFDVKQFNFWCIYLTPRTGIICLLRNGTLIVSHGPATILRRIGSVAHRWLCTERSATRASTTLAINKSFPRISVKLNRLRFALLQKVCAYFESTLLLKYILYAYCWQQSIRTIWSRQPDSRRWDRTVPALSSATENSPKYVYSCYNIYELSFSAFLAIGWRYTVRNKKVWSKLETGRIY